MEVVRSVTVIIVKILIILISVNNVNARTVSTAYSHARRISTYALPQARELKQALGFYEDAYLNFTELTTKYGYQSEEHTVTTDDGYILTLFRILSKCNGQSKLYPVLLMHGLIDSSDVFIISGTNNGLGYILARNCFDVWVANHRGNAYSRKHVSLNPNTDFEYWNYTFDEHGNFDVPAFIDYILKLTGKPKLFYVGHSQGTTSFFVMTSLRPEYNQKIQLSVQLAPVAWMTYIESPLKALAPLANLIREFLDGAGFPEILGKHQLSHFTLELLCHFAPDTCGSLYSHGTGLEPGSLTGQLLSTAFGHLLAGTSTKNLLHFAQLFGSRKFKRFDEGFKGNMMRYQTPKPPEYNISQTTAPVVLISAQNDFLSSSKDVETLSSRLPNLLENYVVPIEKWSHVNHVYDERAPKYVYSKILEYCELYNR